ncbi:MAG: M12 family metallo-peptidase [bacterium]|nr:M12 family metallo-peptidase [bacterium]
MRQLLQLVSLRPATVLATTAVATHRRALALACFGALAAGLPAQNDGLPNLLVPLKGLTDPQAAVTKNILRSQPVYVNLPLLVSMQPRTEIRLGLFPDATYTARFERREILHGDPTTFNWHGTLAESPGSQFIVSVYRDAVVAWFFTADPEHPNSFVIQGAPGMLCVREVVELPGSCGCGADHVPHRPAPAGGANARRRTRAGGGSATGGSGGSGAAAASTCSNDPNRIDVLFAFTRQARRDAGGYNQANAEVQAMLAQANTAMANTPNYGTPIQFYDAYVTEVPTHAGWDMSTQLGHLTYRVNSVPDPTGVWDALHDDRLRFDADLVALIVHDDPAHGATTGIAWIGDPPLAGYGFSITERTSLGNLTLAHELGHNLGCNHERNSTGTNHPYAHGYWDRYQSNVSTTGFAHTVMSYQPTYACSTNTCNYVRFPVFSSPLVTLQVIGYPSVPGGSATHDNGRRILEHSQAVANYSIDIQPPPLITSHPADATIGLGYNAPRVLMSVAADYANTYQWQHNGQDIPGQTTPDLQLVISDATQALAGAYRCRVENCRNQVTYSNSATLTVAGPFIRRRITPSQPGAGFGRSLAPIGDFDGDGYNDFGIGQPDANGASGYLRIISGRTHELLSEHVGCCNGLNLGTSIAGGDFHNEGRGSLLAGSPGSGGVAGGIFVITSSCGWTNPGDPGCQGWLVQPPAGESIGHHLATGHFNADGRLDVLFTETTNGVIDTFVAGTRTNGVYQELWRRTPLPGAEITSLAVIGDRWIDGYDDWAVGYSGWANGNGLVILGKGNDGSGVFQLSGDPNEQLGAHIAALGDVDGDDRPDFAVAGPGWNGVGRIRVQNGPITPLTQAAGSPGNELGWSLAAAGDFDNDGVVDVMVCNGPGRVEIRSGANAASVLYTFGPTFGTGVSTVPLGMASGDSNGDGAPDYLIENRTAGTVAFYHDELIAHPGSHSLYGNACADSAGRLARVEAEGAPLGGHTNHVLFKAAVPNSFTLIQIGLQRTTNPLAPLGFPADCTQHLVPVTGLLGFLNSAGSTQYDFHTGTTNALVGVEVLFQHHPYDPGLTSPVQLTASSALGITVGGF